MKMSRKHSLLFLFVVLMCFSLTLTGVFGAGAATEPGSNAPETALAADSSATLPDLFEGVGTEGLTLGDSGLKAAGETHYLAFASDRHGNTTAIVNAMGGMPSTVEYVSLIGDMVGSGGSDAPAYNTNTILSEVKGVFPGLANANVSVLKASHDAGATDGAGILISSSGQVYPEGNASSSIPYYVYAVSYSDMESSSSSSADNFKTWVDNHDDGYPIIVICHQPIHSSRNNSGAVNWNKALNYASTGEVTTASGKEVTRNVVFLHGHNHTTESNHEYYAPVGSTLTAGGSTSSTIYYTYTTAGYLNANNTATLIGIDDDSIDITKYQNKNVANIYNNGSSVGVSGLTDSATHSIQRVDANNTVAEDEYEFTADMVSVKANEDGSVNDAAITYTLKKNGETIQPTSVTYAKKTDENGIISSIDDEGIIAFVDGKAGTATVTVNVTYNPNAGAKAIDENGVFTDSQDITVTVTEYAEHNWSTSPVWVWSEDFSSATAKFGCLDYECEEEYIAEATVEATENEPTCQEAKIYTYTATVTGPDGLTYTDIKTTGGTHEVYVYKLVDTMAAGKEYLITSTNTAGDGYVLNNDSGSVAATAVTIYAPGEDEDIDANYILADDIIAGNIWNTTTNSSGFTITNNLNDQTYYLEAAGSTSAISIPTSQAYSARYWIYDESALQFIGGNRTHYIFYENGFKSTNNGAQNVYIYERTTMTEGETGPHDFHYETMNWDEGYDSAHAVFRCSICNTTTTVDATISHENREANCDLPTRTAHVGTVSAEISPDGEGHVDDSKYDVTLFPEQVTKEAKVYKLVNSISTNKKYLIVNANTAGTAHAVANGNNTDGASVTDANVTIINATIDGSAATYVESTNLDSAAVWEATGSSTSFNLKNEDCFLYPSNTGLRVDTSSRNWTASNSSYDHYLRYSNYYLNYNTSNNSWACTWSNSSSTYQVYFFEEMTGTITTTEYHQVDPLGHTFGAESFTAAKDPTCEEVGNIAYYTCDRCGKHFATADTSPEAEALDNVTIPATAHDYQSVFTAPTCTEQGYTTHTCSRCGDSYVDSYVDALGHDWGEWIQTTAPTCTEKGTDTRTCSRCDATETREVAALGHNMTPHAAVSATCTEAGNSAYWSCDRCNKFFSDETGENEIEEDSWVIPAKNHAWDEGEVTTPATCSAEGEMTYTCKNDPNHTKTEVIPIDEDAHEWDEGEVTTPATCSAEGVKTYTCKHDPNHTKTEVIPIDEDAHEWDEGEVTTPATCSVEGVKTFTCKHNDKHTKTEAIPIDANAHSWDEGKITTPATCSAEGVKTYTCQHDSEHTYTEPIAIDANAHEWDEGTVTKAATCSAEGEMTYTCKHNSEHTYTEPIAIDANAHEWDEGTVTKAATCSAEGEMTYTCKHNSEHTYTEAIPIDEDAHTPGEPVHENEVPATCSAEGSYDEVIYCSVCEAELSREKKTIEKISHTEEVIPAKDPTCTETGLTSGVKCSVCGEILTAQEEVPALGHDWGESTYTWSDDYSKVIAIRICGNDPKHIEAETVSASSETTDPTCEGKGKTVYTSAAFENSAFEVQTKEVEIPALGHDFGEWTQTKAPTCTEAGEETRYCSRCDAFETREVEALGHDYVAVVTDPTCTAGGYTTYTCSRCGDSYTADETEALGHDFGEWTETKAPTCTEAGEETRTCSRCDAFETREVEALGHDYVAVVTDPTCTAGGYTTYTCSRCGDSYTADDVEALGHDFGEWTETKAPTCTEAGEETRTCSRCGEIETRAVEATGHDWGEPTYTWSDDYSKVIAIRVCANDPKHIEAETVTASSATTDPTCTETGKTVYTGAAFENPDFKVQTKEVVIEALGHAYGDWELTTNPTCTEKGVETRTCSRCDATETRDVEALGHDYQAVVTGPTCTEGGYTTYTCSRCGDSYTADETAALGHNWKFTEFTWSEDNKAIANYQCQNDTSHIETVSAEMTAETTDATCTEAGTVVYTATVSAEKSLDGTAHTEKKTVSDTALGHDWGDISYTWSDDYSKVIAIRICGNDPKHIEAETVSASSETTDPTCEGKGKTVYTSAAFENSAFEVQTKEVEIPALGHDFGEWTQTKAPTCTEAGEETRTCSRCDAFETREVEALGHDYVAVVTDPTCTAGGYTTYTCSRCGDSYTADETEALGHDFGEWTETKAPTCTEAGEETRTCSHCDAFETREVEALGHDYVAVVTDPTCTEGGYTTYTCSRCGDSYTADETEALGHDFGEWTETKAPTCTEAGEETRTCSRCGEIETQSLAAAGHQYGEPVFRWNDDMTADLVVSCIKGDDELITPAEVTSEAGTGEDEGYTIYTAKASYDGEEYTDVKKVENEKIPVTSVTLNKDSLTLTAGGSDMLSVTVEPSDATDQKSMWASSDDTVATVDENGKVTAVGPGTATITVTVDGVSATCNVVIDRWLFDDVQDETQYYFEPVYWAYYHDPQITNGVTKKLFAPDAICTRAQVVSFLWRAHGEQEPITADNPFVDVPQNQYYYKAVLWAVEEGITVGISSTQFDPEGKCTRAQVATFLWRSQECPEPTTAVNPFKDVGSGKYYYKAVLWAVENKITNGTSATTFGPDNPCSRAQIVTFLYRDMNL